MPLKAQRIHNQGGTPSAAEVAVGTLWFLLVGAFLSLVVGSLLDSQQVVVAVFVFWCAVVVAVALHVSLHTPVWIEAGDRFTYGTLLRTRSYEWSDVYSVQFRHVVSFEAPSTDDEFDEVPDPYYRSGTEVVVVLANCKRTCVGLPYVWDTESTRHSFGHSRDGQNTTSLGTLVTALAEGLTSDDADTRRRAAQALGCFEPDAVLGVEGEPRKGHEDDFLHAANSAERRAEQSQGAVRDAIVYLKHSTNDTNADVRRAAADALCRIESHGID